MRPEMKGRGGDRDSGDIRLIGCCGAYCRTCRSLILGSCRGCKLGYEEGKRDIARARCRMKVCCFGTRKLETCAECPEYATCETLAGFHGKNGHQYRKYRDSLDFIRAHGHPEFVRRAKGWKRAYGEL